VLRVPGWCRSATLTLPGTSGPLAAGPGLAEQTRQWTAGETLVLEVDTPVRITRPDPRVDAVRGCVAVERGPLVYCLEAADLPAGIELEDVRRDSGRDAEAVALPELGDGVVGVTVPVVVDGIPDEVSVTAVPYLAWGNRTAGAMRVWIPT
jgi:DUF1680 family protein